MEHITFKEWIKRNPEYDTEERCTRCHGAAIDICDTCKGEGIVECPECEVERDCEDCDGAGKFFCPACDGTGRKAMEEYLKQLRKDKILLKKWKGDKYDK